MHVTVLQHKLQSTSSVTSQYPSFSTRSRSSTRHKVESVYEVMNFQHIQGRKVETEVITQTQFVPFLRDKCQKIQHRTSTKHETLLGLRSIMYKADVLWWFEGNTPQLMYLAGIFCHNIWRFDYIVKYLKCKSVWSISCFAIFNIFVHFNVKFKILYWF